MNRILLMVLRNFWKVPKAYWKLCHYAKNTDKYTEMERWKHLQYIMGLAVKSGNLELRVEGLENIPEKDGFLVIGNHQGMFDIVAIAATCPRPMGAILKKELKDIPFLKQIIACTQSFPMDREDIKQSMEVIIKVIKELKKGRNYLIFPEGTRSRKGNEILEFHGGSFKCALKAKCPILPIAFVDSFKVLDQKGSAPVCVQLHYLEPIPYEEFKDMNTIELAAMVRGRIEEAVKANSQ